MKADSKLEVKQLTLKTGHKCLFQNLNLNLHPGEIWGILGPNGCGKTTLLHTLAGLVPISSGEILLNGKNIGCLSPRYIAQAIAILFQNFNDSFMQSVWQYCAASRYPHLPYFAHLSRADEEIINKALLLTELTDKAQQSIQTLSGGEKQRLRVAAVLIQTPDIYLLDEPLNHLDVRHKLQLLKHLQHLATSHNAIICMSLHDINLAQQFCNRLLLLYADGSLLAGTPQEICSADHLTRLYGHPIKEIQPGDSFWWFEL